MKLGAKRHREVLDGRISKSQSHKMILEAIPNAQNAYLTSRDLTMCHSIIRSPCFHISVLTHNAFHCRRYFVGFLATIMLCKMRTHIRKRDRIPGCAGCFGDFCLSLWCQCCVTSQLLRHEGLKKHHYNFFHPEGKSNVEVYDV